MRNMHIVFGQFIVTSIRDPLELWWKLGESSPNGQNFYGQWIMVFPQIVCQIFLWFTARMIEKDINTPCSSPIPGSDLRSPWFPFHDCVYHVPSSAPMPVKMAEICNEHQSTIILTGLSSWMFFGGRGVLQHLFSVFFRPWQSGASSLKSLNSAQNPLLTCWL